MATLFITYSPENNTPMSVYDFYNLIVTSFNGYKKTYITSMGENDHLHSHCCIEVNTRPDAFRRKLVALIAKQFDGMVPYKRGCRDRYNYQLQVKSVNDIQKLGFYFQKNVSQQGEYLIDDYLFSKLEKKTVIPIRTRKLTRLMLVDLVIEKLRDLEGCAIRDNHVYQAFVEISKSGYYIPRQFWGEYHTILFYAQCYLQGKQISVPKIKELEDACVTTIHADIDTDI